MQLVEAMFPAMRHAVEAQSRNQGRVDIRAEADADRLVAVAHRPEARSLDDAAVAALDRQRIMAAKRALARAEALLPHHPATRELRQALAALDAR